MCQSWSIKVRCKQVIDLREVRTESLKFRIFEIELWTPPPRSSHVYPRQPRRRPHSAATQPPRCCNAAPRPPQADATLPPCSSHAAAATPPPHCYMTLHVLSTPPSSRPHAAPTLQQRLRQRNVAHCGHSAVALTPPQHPPHTQP